MLNWVDLPISLSNHDWGYVCKLHGFFHCHNLVEFD
jgi:hypothetical protein